MTTFTLPGDPVAWSRAGKNGKRHFTKPKQAAHMIAVKWAAKDAGIKPAHGPVRLTIWATFAVPPSLSRAEKARRMAAPHVQKPDADNVAKLVKDALNGIGYDDDAQVSELTVRKAWGPEGRTVVTLEAAT